MPDELDVDTDDQTNDDAPGIKDLRRRAKEADEADARAQAAERRAVFAEAGVPSNGRIASMFRDTYKGDLNEEAVKAAWTELQAEMGNPSTTVDDVVNDQVADMAASRGPAGEVIDPADEPKPDKSKQAWEAFTDARKQGRPESAASAEVSSRLIDGAVKGEEWAQVRPWTAEEMRDARIHTT